MESIAVIPLGSNKTKRVAPKLIFRMGKTFDVRLPERGRHFCIGGEWVLMSSINKRRARSAAETYCAQYLSLDKHLSLIDVIEAYNRFVVAFES